MANENLNKLCMDESDPMLNAVRDKEEVDPRSSFILPRLVNKINELEQELCIRQVHVDNLRNSNLLLERRLNRSGGSPSDGADGVFYTYKRKISSKPRSSPASPTGTSSLSAATLSLLFLL
ncbi:hypothetical protein H5410_023512 [Solanum commersonii]|uniref:Uncharacterized protein n=1 Tax=Solanum commersonii TaxID=4109 RepID=A0A9J5ZJ47_SOLCO|nr:hypothetical protein H5410_023512 [Solanum commersonii]